MRHARYCLVASALIGLTAPVHATLLSSDASAVSTTLAAGGIAKVGTTTGAVSGTAGAAYNQSASQPAINQNVTLVAPSLLNAGAGGYESLSTGAFTTLAYSTLPGSATASATINNLATSFYTQLGGLTLASLGISARTITSTTTAGIGANGLYASGTSTLSGLALTGGLLGTLGIDVGALTSPLANYTLFASPTLTITLNEQQQTRSANALSLSTNALHLAFSDYVLDGQALRGDVIVGHSEASVAGAVPEPASWALMVGGFGLLGGALRRPRPDLRLA